MSYDIYLCFDCAWPICFPNGQKMHIGTGWYCWRTQQKGDGGSDAGGATSQSDVPPSQTDPALRLRLAQNATRLYGEWVHRRNKVRLLPFLRRQLTLRRGDVLKDFLRYLAHQREHDAAALLRELTQAPEWSRFAPGLIPTYAPKRKGRAARKGASAKARAARAGSNREDQ